jgi:hypothetical protein
MGDGYGKLSDKQDEILIPEQKWPNGKTFL